MMMISACSTVGLFHETRLPVDDQFVQETQQQTIEFVWFLEHQEMARTWNFHVFEFRKMSLQIVAAEKTSERARARTYPMAASLSSSAPIRNRGISKWRIVGYS